MTAAFVQDNMVISIEYTVWLDDGEVLDTSEGRAPLQYIHGFNMIIPGLEEALTGMQEGQSRKVKITPADGYGEIIDIEPEWLPIDIFPQDAYLAPGIAFQAEDGLGGIVTLYIREVQDDRVQVDYNHPLAGETLHFEVAVVGVRPATAEEIEHGHIHSGDHHSVQ